MLESPQGVGTGIQKQFKMAQAPEKVEWPEIQMRRSCRLDLSQKTIAAFGQGFLKPVNRRLSTEKYRSIRVATPDVGCFICWLAGFYIGAEYGEGQQGGQ